MGPIPSSDLRSYLLVLVAICACGFVLPFSSLIISPLLVDLSRDFDVSLAETGQLVVLGAIPGAALSLIVGPVGDLYGRRIMLVGGTMLLGLSLGASALSPSYGAMVVTRVVTGFAAAALGPAMFAAPADLFVYSVRGRAYGYLQASTTLAAIVGLPAATLLAAQYGWRWSFAFAAAASIGASILLLRYPGSSTGTASPLKTLVTHGYLPVLRAPGARAILGSSVLLGLAWMGLQTYIGAFFITRYGIGTGDLAPITALQGVGLLVGSQIAPRLGDRVGYKVIAVWAVAVAAAIEILLIATTSTVQIAAALNFLLAIPMAMRFTSFSMLISEAVPSARGTMNAMNSTFWATGTVIGAYVGGMLVETYGFGALGVLTAVGSVCSAMVLGRFFPTDKPALRLPA